MYTGISGLADKENRVLYQYCGHTGGNSHGHGGVLQKVCGAARGSGGCQWTGKLG